MKRLVVIATIGLLGLILAVILAIYPYPSRTADQFAVANAFGQLQAFLVSKNYSAAYEMMSADFRNTHSLNSFQTRDEHGAITRRFSKCDWGLGAKIKLNGSQAELRIKYNVSFGTIFYFVKEDEHWRFTDRADGFETLLP